MNFSSKSIVSCIKALAIASFFVPLVVLPSSFIFPFIVPKIVLFRSIVVVMVGLYIVLLSVDYQTYRPRLSLNTLAVALFYLSFVVSTFVGVDWYRSFWDNHERMLGLFTVTHYVLYYIILTSVMKGWNEWRSLLRAFLCAGSIVMCIGLLQSTVSPDLLLNQGSNRVSATLGNSIYFSGYGSFLLFVGLLLGFKERAGWHMWKYIALFGGLLGLWGVFGGGTRGTILSLIAGFFVLCVSLLFTLKDSLHTKKIIVSVFAGGFVVIALLGLFRTTEFVQSIPGVNRLIDTDFTVVGSTVPRVMAWGIAWESFLEKPLFGWGPNNFYYAFNTYYRPEFLLGGWGETWFDNAHNIIMNTLSVQGVVGIILYALVFLTMCISLVRAYRQGLIEPYFLSFGIAFLAAHFVHNVTVFEDPTSYLYFLFALAMFNAMSVSMSPPKVSKETVAQPLLFIVGLSCFLVIFVTNINPARANNATLNALRYLPTDLSFSFAEYERASSIPSPHIDDIRNDYARSFIGLYPKLAQGKDGRRAVEILQLLRLDLDKNIALHPYDIRLHIQQSQIVYLLATTFNDTALLEEQVRILQYAFSQSPKRQQVAYMLAYALVQVGRADEAVEIMTESIKENQTIPDGWWRLALMYEGMGNIDMAKSLLLEAKQKDVVFTDVGKDIVQRILATSTF